MKKAAISAALVFFSTCDSVKPNMADHLTYLDTLQTISWQNKLFSFTKYVYCNGTVDKDSRVYKTTSFIFFYLKLIELSIRADTDYKIFSFFEIKNGYLLSNSTKCLLV